MFILCRDWVYSHHLLRFSLTKSISSFNHACSDNAMAPITPLNPGLERNDNTRSPQRTCFQISAVIASIFIEGLWLWDFWMHSGNVLLIELSQNGPRNNGTGIADFVAPRGYYHAPDHIGEFTESRSRTLGEDTWLMSGLELVSP